MANLPEGRIDDRQARSDHLPIVKIGNQAEQSVAASAHGRDQLVRGHVYTGDRRCHWGVSRKFLTD
jgi:hypothetical protein